MKINRKLKILSLLILSSSVIFIYKLTNYNNINLTSIGDGLAKGIDCYGRIDYGYNDYIKDYLKKINKLKGYSVEFTEENMTIEHLLNKLLTSNKLKETLRDTDYLTISIGLNDFLSNLSLYNNFSNKELEIIMSEIEKNFNILISEIRKVYSRDIYLVGYYSTGIKNSFFEKGINKLNNIYKNNKEIIYIETETISNNPNMFRPNPRSYYPNYKGYQLISTKIIDKMRKKLEK